MTVPITRWGRGSAALLCALAALLVSGTPPAAASGVPQDPNSTGFVGLCDRHNHSVVGGEVGATPFVWKAVASVAPPAQFQGPGENTILNIYQPRPDVDPGDWSGDQLTGASFYATRRAPAAQATLKDISLAVIVREFPPRLDGLYELRMYFAKKGVGLYNGPYPSTFIQVTGNHWRVVRGGTVNCAASTAESDEVLSGAVAPKVAYGDTPPRAAQGHPSAAPTHAALASNSPAEATTGNSGPAQSPVAAETATRPSSSDTALPWVVAAAALVAAAGFAVAWRLRSRQQT